MRQRNVSDLLEPAQRLGRTVRLQPRLALGRVQACVIGSRRLVEVGDQLLHAAAEDAHEQPGHEHGSRRDDPLLGRARRALADQDCGERRPHEHDLRQRLGPPEEVEGGDAHPDVEERVDARAAKREVDRQRDQRCAEREGDGGAPAREPAVEGEQDAADDVGHAVDREQPARRRVRGLREHHRCGADRRAGDVQDPEHPLEHLGRE